MSYEARFTPTADDVVTAHRMHQRETAFARCLYPVAGIALVALFCVLGRFFQQPRMMVVGAVLGVMSGGHPFLVEWQIRRAGQKAKTAEVRYRFSEEGIEFWSNFGQLNHTWDLVTRASLDERGILICTGPSNYTFVPARAFVSGYFPREELKALLFAELKKPDPAPKL